MPASHVVDASVLGAALFREALSGAAIDFLAPAPSLAAPALLTAEMASLAAKKVWREEATVEVAERALAAVGDLVDELAPCTDFAPAALRIACEHRLSAYDSLYLALAISRDLPLVTFDRRLIERVRAQAIAVRIVEPAEL